MPAKDAFHEAVVDALDKEDWEITEDPFYIEFAQVEMYIDLGAEKLLAAEKESQKIAVEIKSFLGSSAISEFHTAIGQYMNYRLALGDLHPDRILDLAVPEDTYNEFFVQQFGQLAITHYKLKLIVYNVARKEIIRWLE
ncbi:MAG: XisH family protein [Chloroflexota bacterium]